MSDTAMITPEVRFPSLVAMRLRHTDLLRRSREMGDLTELIPSISQFIQAGTATGAVLDEDDERQIAQSWLDYWSSLIYRQGIEPPDALLSEFDPTLAPELPDELCPYIGLDAFDEQHANVFFGRNRLLAKCVGILENSRILAVISDSGSGKSSLVLGGLIPALKAGALADSAKWHYVPRMVPGSRPIINLARLLRPAEERSASWLAEQTALLREDSRHLATMIDARWQQPVVIVIDQFEELFTVCDDQATREAFVANIIALIDVAAPRHTVVLTMRSDFESRLVQLPLLYERLEAHQVRVTALSAADLREAIEYPADVVGLKFEAGIVDALISEILGEPAGLPLLQFTLLKLWETRQRNRITWQAYNALGGVREALTRSADQFYASLIPEEQETAKRILLQMVRPGEGLEVTSRRIRRTSLYHTGEARERIDRVLSKLIAARLVRSTSGETASDEQVEVAHEALVRNWRQLGTWLTEERTALERRRRLDIKAAEWVGFGRGAAGLLDASQLTVAAEWLASPEAIYIGTHEALPDLVRASREVLEAAESERQTAEANQRELEKAQLLAEAERARADLQTRATQRLRLLALVMALMMVVAIITSLIAVQSRRLADAAYRVSNARFLATEGQNQFEAHPLRGLRLALEGLVRTSPGSTAHAQVFSATVQLMAQGRIHTIDDKIEAVYASPNGATFVAVNAEGEGQLYRTDTLSVTPLLAGEVDAVFFSADGTALVVGYFDAPAELRRTDNDTVIPLAGRVAEVTFSPDGTALVVGYFDAPSELRHTNTEHIIQIFSNRIYDVFFSPNGKLLVVDYYEDVLDELRNTYDGTSIVTLPGKIDFVTFSPKEELFLINYYRFPAELREINTGMVRTTFTPTFFSLFSFRPDDFSTDGSKLAVYSSPSEIWNTATGTVLNTLNSHASSIIFSPDGEYFVVDYEGDILDELRQTNTNSIITTLPGQINNGDITFSPDGELFLVNYLDSSTELRKTQNGSVLKIFDVPTNIYTSPKKKIFITNNNELSKQLEAHSKDSLIVTILDTYDSGFSLDETFDSGFSLDETFLWIKYSDGNTEISDIQGVRLTNLGVGVEAVSFSDNLQRALVHYSTGEVYLLDLEWLRAMGGNPAALPEAELVRLACQGPLASGLWTPEDQAALEAALDGDEPQACQ